MRCSRALCGALRRLGVGAPSSASAATTCAWMNSSAVRYSSTNAAPEKKRRNPYSVLGIKEGANKDQIKKAYRVMARKHHPDAPGGNHEKFQEIQEAYEQIKSGVWIRKDEGGSGSGDGGEERSNTYSRFRYTTRTHNKSKVSYDDFYREMHTGEVKKDPFGDDDDAGTEGGKPRRANPFAPNELAFQAWIRCILLWCFCFVVLRVSLFLMFPPQWEKPKRKPAPKALRKPPPRPLAQDAIVS